MLRQVTEHVSFAPPPVVPGLALTKIYSNLDDCDVPPLRNEDFELSVSQSDAEFVMKHAELCAIVSDLVRTHFSVKATKSHDAKSKALQTLDARVAEWFVRLPSEFQNIAGGYRSEDSSSANGLLLHLSYNAILTQFHRLLIKGSSEGVTDDESRAHEDICSEASSNTLTIFEQLSRQSSLHRCWFAAPSFLFAAMLQARSQMRSNNPILALKARARETSGLRSLRSLSKHWLFATSVWRLFRSNSISHTATATATPKPSETQGLGGQDSPGQASSIATASSMHLVPMVNSIPEEREHLVQENATADYNGQLDSMSWIQFANPSDSAPANLYTDQGRMQQSLHDWQSVYWSDPLADLSLSGGIGDFNLQWPL
jgi:transcriptional regulatory protein AMDR